MSGAPANVARLELPCFEIFVRLGEASAGCPSERFAEEEGSSPMAPAARLDFDEVPSEEGYPALGPQQPRGYGFLTKVAV
jgi:hypothetical protein